MNTGREGYPLKSEMDSVECTLEAFLDALTPRAPSLTSERGVTNSMPYHEFSLSGSDGEELME